MYFKYTKQCYESNSVPESGTKRVNGTQGEKRRIQGEVINTQPRFWYIVYLRHLDELSEHTSMYSKKTAAVFYEPFNILHTKKNVYLSLWLSTFLVFNLSWGNLLGTKKLVWRRATSKTARENAYGRSKSKRRSLICEPWSCHRPCGESRGERNIFLRLHHFQCVRACVHAYYSITGKETTLPGISL